LYLVWQLLEKDVGEVLSLTPAKRQKMIHLCLLAIILFPTAQFYGATYNDALFFFLATATLWLGRSRQWSWAVLCGFLATLTRLNGLALWFFVAVEYLETQLFLPSMTEKGVDSPFWKPRWWLQNWQQVLGKCFTQTFLATFLIPVAFGAYLAFHQLTSGSWHVVFGNMQIWHQDKVTLPPQVVWRYLKILATFAVSQYQYWVAVLELASVLAYVGAIIYGWRRIRPSYWLFFVVSIAIPWLTGSFQGMPRYGLHIYPLFLLIALFLSARRPWVQWLYLLVSVTLFFFYTIFFTRGYFVA
jgi:hypothetical protein